MPCSGLVCALHVHSVSVAVFCCCILFALEDLSEMNFELNFKFIPLFHYSAIPLFCIFQYPLMCFICVTSRVPPAAKQCTLIFIM